MRIISFILLITFLCINPAYPDTLRPQLASNTSVGKDRQETLQRQAFLNKYGLSRFLTREEALEYLDTVSEVISIHTGQPQATDAVEQWLKMGKVSIAEKKDDRTKVVCSVPLINKTVLASSHTLTNDAALRQVRALERAGDRDLNKIINNTDLGLNQRLNLARNAVAKFEEAQDLVHAQDLKDKRQRINGKLRRARRELHVLTAKVDRLKKLASNTSLDEGYDRMADWIAANSKYKTDIEDPEARVKEITRDLKDGKVIFEHTLEETSPHTREKERLSFRRGIKLTRNDKWWTVASFDKAGAPTASYHYRTKTFSESIPEEILELFSTISKISLARSSINYNIRNFIVRRRQVFTTRLKDMTEETIDAYMLSLGKDVWSPDNVKKAIIRKET